MVFTMNPTAVRICVGVSLLIILLYFLICYSSEETEVKSGRELLIAWKTCMMKNLSIVEFSARATWDNIAPIVGSCSDILGDNLRISKLQNKDEIKYHIFSPKTTKNVVLTIGVGTDVDAEKHLKDNVEMFGADPIVDINEGLYSQIGSFFPFAVGANAGISQANVLVDNRYVTKTVVHVDLLYFLNNIVRRKFYDALWLDAENAEYQMFPMFYRGGALDQNGITFCQINMEIHIPTDEKMQQAHDFYFSVVNDERCSLPGYLTQTFRYAIYKIVQIGHHRLYLINLDDEECLDRYKTV